MRAVAQRVAAGIRRVAGTPLLLSQALSSAAGAGAVVFAASWMGKEEFAHFVLFNLISVTLVGFVRAFLFQPALIAMRANKTAKTPFHYALAGSLAAATVLAGTSALIAGLTPAETLVLFVSGVFPILHDWLRFRSIAWDRRWDCALADGIRLLMVLASPIMLMVTPTAVAYQAYLGMSLVVPVVAIWLRTPRLATYAPLGSYIRPASLQFVDFLFGQFNSTIPLLVIGGIGATPLVAGVRFAQTLLGPLNLIFAAGTIGLSADGATRSSHARSIDMIKHGSRRARRTCGAAAVVVTTLSAVVWLTDFELRSIDHDSLLYGLLLVGAVSLGSGWAGFHAIVMRLIGNQGIVTLGRIGLVAVSLTFFAIGFVAAGVDGSLVAGFLAGAVAAPLAFGPSAFILYRREFGRHEASVVLSARPDPVPVAS